MKHRKLETTQVISRRMSQIKTKGNKVEKALAKKLWHKGYRYRLNYKKLPGTPDIVITKYFIVIFIDGEFWHGKNFENLKVKNNRDYWREKIRENMDRDQLNDRLLIESGWIPLHFWSRDIERHLDDCVNIIEEFIDYQKKGFH